MEASLGQQLRACGRHGLPPTLTLDRGQYQLVRVFKHDFFAATALYRQTPAPQSNPCPAEGCPPGPTHIVLKQARCCDFLGLPLQWLGAALCRHEWSILCRLRGLKQVPKPLRQHGPTGLIYEYIPGRSLDERPEVPAEFFDRLRELLQLIHQRRVAYIDMNKRGNILVGPDGLPYLIDFQISQHLPARLLGSRRWAAAMLTALTREDHYHLLKHKRRLRPDLMTEDQWQQSHAISSWISLHRLVSRPLTLLRRRILAFLHRADRLVTDPSDRPSPENDPQRWAKTRQRPDHAQPSSPLAGPKLPSVPPQQPHQNRS